MNQTEMLPLVAEANAVNEAKRLELERLTQLHLDTWGRSIGLLTTEQIKLANYPQWQWDDYSI